MWQACKHDYSVDPQITIPHVTFWKLAQLACYYARRAMYPRVPPHACVLESELDNHTLCMHFRVCEGGGANYNIIAHGQQYDVVCYSLFTYIIIIA